MCIYRWVEYVCSFNQPWGNCFDAVAQTWPKASLPSNRATSSLHRKNNRRKAYLLPRAHLNRLLPVNLPIHPISARETSPEFCPSRPKAREHFRESDPAREPRAKSSCTTPIPATLGRAVPTDDQRSPSSPSPSPSPSRSPERPVPPKDSLFHHLTIYPHRET